jgi:hypothetical protein
MVLAIAAFLVGLVAIDRGLGAVLAASHARVRSGGEAGLVNLALSRADVDLMVFGSSRAVHHVDPSVLEARLGVRAHNAGCDGQGLLYARMLEALLLARDTGTRLFLLQVDPKDLFMAQEREELHRAMVFAPWFGESPEVDAILERRGPTTRIKLWSHTYRYNSMLLPILANLARPEPAHADGFVALGGRLDPARHTGRDGFAPEEPSPWMEGRLRAFVRAGRDAGIEVAVFSGPRYRFGRPRPADETAALERLAALVRDEGARFLALDEQTVPALRDAALYRDPAHLNRDGAAIFSTRLAERLAPLLGRP